MPPVALWRFFISFADGNPAGRRLRRETHCRTYIKKTRPAHAEIHHHDRRIASFRRRQAAQGPAAVGRRRLPWRRPLEGGPRRLLHRPLRLLLRLRRPRLHPDKKHRMGRDRRRTRKAALPARISRRERGVRHYGKMTEMSSRPNAIPSIFITFAQQRPSPS